MFGIKVEGFPLHRRCECGDDHECEAFAVTSTAPKHKAEKRPIRSKVAWYIGDPNQPPAPGSRDGT